MTLGKFPPPRSFLTAGRLWIPHMPEHAHVHSSVSDHSRTQIRNTGFYKQSILMHSKKMREISKFPVTLKFLDRKEEFYIESKKSFLHRVLSTVGGRKMVPEMFMS